MSRPTQWAATLTGGLVASTGSVVAVLGSWWATLPPELRGLVGAAFAGLLGELVTVARAWVRRRASLALGVPEPDQVSPHGEAVERADTLPPPPPAEAARAAERGSPDGLR